jgi:rod shape-determining protein MreD
MKLLFYFVLGLAFLWLQLTLAPLLEVGWIKPNLALLSVVVTGVRWMDPWLFLYAAPLGLAQDALSHGVLGVYGTSFFFISFAARLMGASIYEHNLLFSVLGVLALCLAEGLMSVTFLHLLDAGVPWWAWILERALPEAVYNALLAPVLFYGLRRLERRLKWSPT